MIACFDMAAGAGGSRRGAADGGASAGGSKGDSPKRKPGSRSVGPVRIDSTDDARAFDLGAPCVVSAAAPSPHDHPAGKSDEEIAAVFTHKTQRREQAIQRILEAEKAKDKPIERFVAAIRYDSELAPTTTNRRQLLELGIEVPTADTIPKSDADVHRTLWTIIYGLARLGIYLTGTDGLDDRALLSKLCTRILDDAVADIPPSRDMSEFIDCAPLAEGDAAKCSDGLSGPFDFGPMDDDDDLSRAGVRDRLLPRPDRR